MIDWLATAYAQFVGPYMPQMLAWTSFDGEQPVVNNLPSSSTFGCLDQIA
jgi:hypothetical protein